MTKISINVYLNKTKKEHIKAIKIDNIIKYKDDALNILDIKNQKLKRTTNEYEIILDFKNNQGTYKDKNFEIPIHIKIKQIIDKENLYYIKYEQTILDETNTYIYKIEVEQ